MTGSDPGPSPDDAAPSPQAGEEAARLRRARQLREQVFGDVLPDTTKDDRDLDTREPFDNDEWLRSNVPPHHG